MTTTQPVTGRQATKTFADFDVDPALCEALDDAGIHHPFPIQELTLPLALAGADIIGQARTGTGKTLAFGLPMLQRIDTASGVTQVLVIVPTRELCVQVREDLAKAGAKTDVRVAAVYGGKSLDPQIRELRDGAEIVVGTPGRLLDLKGRGVLDLSTVTGLVLDEADEMLDLGFLPDVEQLIEAVATDRQTLLFSATMPSAVVGLARRYMRKPTFLRADVEEVRIAPETRQHFFSCHRLDKPAVLARILQTPNRELCVVFTRTKRMADILANELRDRGISASPIHSDLRQEARERALDRFRKGKIDVLVATEVAARGLDIDDVTHVVNYDCPDDDKMYLHRIGRTGRAGAAGVAITLAVWNELARLEMIKRALEVDEPTHEVFSTSEILDDIFDLPSRDEPRAGRTRGQAADEATAPAPTAAPPDERQDRRGKSRRRRRGRSGDRERPAETSTEAPQPAAEPPAAGGDAGAGTRRRVRRRTTTTGPERTAADTPEPQEREQTQRTEQRRTRERRRSTQAGAGEQREPKRDEGTSRRADGGGKQPRIRQGDGNRQGRGGGRRRSRDRRSQSRDTAQPRRSQPVDAAAARGTGQPRLRRPLDVVHLP